MEVVWLSFLVGSWETRAKSEPWYNVMKWETYDCTWGKSFSFHYQNRYSFIIREILRKYSFWRFIFVLFLPFCNYIAITVQLRVILLPWTIKAAKIQNFIYIAVTVRKTFINPSVGSGTSLFLIPCKLVARLHKLPHFWFILIAISIMEGGTGSARRSCIPIIELEEYNRIPVKATSGSPVIIS